MIIYIENILIRVAVPEADRSRLAGRTKKACAPGTILHAGYTLTSALWRTKRGRNLKRKIFNPYLPNKLDIYNNSRKKV